METPLRPVPDAPALVVGAGDGSDDRWLVISDLHLGLESGPSRPAGPPEATAAGLADELVSLADQERAGGLLIAGDVKHPIVGTPPYLRPVVFDFFAGLLENGVAVRVVLGNHDVGLARHLPREVTVHGPEGTVVGEVGIFHGHRWPSADVLSRPRLIAGHLHPGYRFAPTAEHPDGKRRCWLRCQRTPPAAPRSRRKRPAHWIAATEVVVLPPFNPIAGVESLNRERPGRGRSFLYRRFLADGLTRAYLLDGTDLGVLPIEREGTESRPRGRSAPRAR